MCILNNKIFSLITLVLFICGCATVNPSQNKSLAKEGRLVSYSHAEVVKQELMVLEQLRIIQDNQKKYEKNQQQILKSLREIMDILSKIYTQPQRH